MRTGEGHFYMTIRDNGRGFDVAAAAHRDGFGLENMRTRMNDVGGKLTNDSLPGNGVQISLEIAMQPRPRKISWSDS